jgi:RNA polymerase I specific transcription initiation factor RRN3
MSIRDFSEQKYKSTPLKRVALLLAKLIELYPSCATKLIIQRLIEKIYHKNTPLEFQYMYYRMVFDVVRICPNSEERILEAVVDKLCQIDVDIKNPKSRRKCNAFSSLPKIQPMSAFLKELSLKVPNERETKMGVLFEMLL